ncbi:uncharacterized protein F5891DRAFT_1173949 [Suillus fuscotomentosus]|uniref:Uncharacterized protein n=1 Tax=Suillus fuscotomentosus TaxID=1912939 RepID=A0AAD4HJR2_9AGAM|nr:uncharacterized protein F5891DRAFT_1173949 [Suillus fuscotomentosus]KAG1899067.1 hypothetical protein F5891DRAFT_1173949 [Suillus fuscotomentosus]
MVHVSSGYMFEVNFQLEHKHRGYWHYVQPVRPSGVVLGSIRSQWCSFATGREIVQKPAALSTPDHDPGIEVNHFADHDAYGDIPGTAIDGPPSHLTSPTCDSTTISVPRLVLAFNATSRNAVDLFRNGWIQGIQSHIFQTTCCFVCSRRRVMYFIAYIVTVEAL